MASPLDAMFTRFVRTGDPEALAFVFERTAPALARRARRLLGDGRGAEDLVQDLFLSLLVGCDHYDASRPCRPYLIGALHRRAMRWRARADRLSAEPLPVGACGRDLPPDQLVRGREFAAAVACAVDGLPVASREVVRRYVELHETPQEIGRALGRPAGTVRVQLHRGLRTLRDRLPSGFFAVALAVLLRPCSAKAPPPYARRSPRWLLAGAAVVGVAISLRGFEPAAMAAAPALTAAVAAAEVAHLPLPSGEAIASRVVAEDTLPAAQVRVQLRFADGARAQGVGVFAYRPGSDADFEGRRLISDAAGEVSFSDLEPGVLELSTDRGTHTVVDLRRGDNADPVIVLPAGVAVSGSVVDVAGRPVADAGIWVGHEPRQPWEGQVVARTAADGTFALRDMQPRTSFAAVLAGCVPSSLQATAPLPRRDVVLRLGSPGARVTGIVRAPDGTALKGAVVRIAPHARAQFLLPGADKFADVLPTMEVRTGADGQFACGELPAGRIELSVRAAACASALQPVPLQAGELRNVEIRLRPGRRLHGTVHDAAGNPLGGATVVAHGRARHHWSGVETAADGTFHLAGLCQERLVLEIAAAGFVPRELPLSAATDAAVDIVLQAEPQLRGRLVDALGGAIDAAAFELGWRDGTQEPWDTRSPAPVALAVDGSFRAAAGPGAQFFCRCTGSPVWLPCAIDDRSAEPVVVRVPADADRRCELTVRLLGFTGDQLADAMVVLVRDQEVYLARRPMRQPPGVATIDVPAGDYELIVIDDRGVCPPCSTVVAATTSAKAVDITAPAVGTLRYALRAEGRDVERFRAFVIDPSGLKVPLQRPCATLALGVGHYQLWASGLSFMTVRGLPFEIRAGGETVLDVPTRAAIVRHVAFVLPDGVDATTATVTMRCRGELVLGGEPGLRDRGFDAPADGFCCLAIGLADDDYELDLQAGGSRWRGTFRIGGEDGVVEPVVVSLAPADH